MPENNDNKYAPESPIYTKPNKLNNKIIDKISVKLIKKSVLHLDNAQNKKIIGK